MNACIFSAEVTLIFVEGVNGKREVCHFSAGVTSTFERHRWNPSEAYEFCLDCGRMMKRKD